MIQIGDVLKSLRKQNGLTQQKIADILHISRVCYTRYETNVNRPDYDLLVAICDYYDVSTDFILGRKEL